MSGGDKNARRCLDCPARVNYVRFGVAHPVPAPDPIDKEDTVEKKQAATPAQPRRKVCKKCGALKPLDDFDKCKAARDGRENRCKPCKTARKKELSRQRRQEVDAARAIARQKNRRQKALRKAAESETDKQAFDDMVARCKAKGAAEAVCGGPERSESAQYVALGTRIGMLVSSKQRAYGDSFGKSGAVLRELFPDGVPVERYDDLLCITRILDKLFRIATDKVAFGENPYMDIAGYGLLGAGRGEADPAE